MNERAAKLVQITKGGNLPRSRAADLLFQLLRRVFEQFHGMFRSEKKQRTQAKCVRPMSELLGLLGDATIHKMACSPRLSGHIGHVEQGLASSGVTPNIRRAATIACTARFGEPV
jgi:hypothetical protein